MEKTKEGIKTLLNKTNKIVQKYNEIADISGERFNIFSIIGLQSSETRLHSKLINELLNAKGKHGQKDLFLKLFIDVVNDKIERDIEINNNQEKNNTSLNNRRLKKIVDFNTKSSNSGIELYAGKINIDHTEGGRIDILIKDNQGNGIIIENKIWAGEQKNQLLRYHNFGKKFKTIQLIYLTIEGKNASEFSVGKEELEYVCISYKEEILKWMELCRKECLQLPILRETLTQYINQLKTYSGQSNNHKMKDEIIKTMSENIDGAFEIANNIPLLRKYLMKKLNLELIDLSEKIIQKHKNFQFNYNQEFYTGVQYTGGLIFYKEEWKNKNLIIKFSFDQNNFNGLRYGFVREDSNSSNFNGLIEKNYKNKLFEEAINFRAERNVFWPLYFNFEPLNWENNRNVWIEIQNGELLKKFEDAIEQILTIADKLKL